MAANRGHGENCIRSPRRLVSNRHADHRGSDRVDPARSMARMDDGGYMAGFDLAGHGPAEGLSELFQEGVRIALILFPGKFDINEWFIIIMILVNVIIMLRLPQRLPSTIMLLIMMIGLASAKTLDHIFGTPRLISLMLTTAPNMNFLIY
ncbi:hypothetical protein LJK87_26840 [Paenibacillus sp. P25]|nr:hypothetical protein LJK87_26840 [Paenibacillus sp. P25]